MKGTDDNITVKSRESEQKNYNTHCVKIAQIRSFSVPYFPIFELNTGITRK